MVTQSKLPRISYKYIEIDYTSTSVKILIKAMVILKIKKGFSSGNWFCTSIPDIVDFGVKGQNVVKELEQVQLSVKNLF